MQGPEVFRPDLLAGRTALVTGGGTGLGRAMVETFCALGADAVICGRREETLAKAAAEIAAATGRHVQPVACDVRDVDAVDALAGEACERGCDILVNNAAANFVARTETLSPRAFDAIVDISMKGAANATFACGRRWIADGRGGVVLSIVTSYAWHGSPYVVPSSMAKAGLLAMTRGLAAEWGPKGIRLVAIAPGSFPTPGAWERLVPRADLAARHETANALGRPGLKEELATLAAFLVSEAAGYVTGECVTIDGGRWVSMAGTFGHLSALTDDEWSAMRAGGGG